MKNKIVGYTTGVFDLFHIGHLNVIKKAKENCDYLIVGVTSDEQVELVKNKKVIIPFEERIEIIQSLKFVDEAVCESNTDKLEAWERLRFNRLFKGDDWKGTKKWDNYELEFSKLGVEIYYFEYTKGTSSTQLSNVLKKISLTT
ncbi:adenylyltransferase/cytidyltransferase family protein [Shouchella lehensis]|uniref:Glycerol-3-phosphate cytidylyltransferase n=1 Tax=Shouchella lehensis TaxID=300825 RepID=A0A4Y7WET0_9BACI|nr:adenylyltransferase/cytidyltransferase family protein [Shouchella lehensis]MBG9785022.1 hypothetical protein [Shouchella lehensis]TES46445.1 glycerol-3-phosphate cytidylyltransferase [Shouchella lehensis]